MHMYKINQDNLVKAGQADERELSELEDFVALLCVIIACMVCAACVVKRRYKLVPMQQPFITAPDGSEATGGGGGGGGSLDILKKARGKKSYDPGGAPMQTPTNL
eukprot:SAG22_NODE_557_length_9118_cov_9.050006_8_plen_105_part_00